MTNKYETIVKSAIVRLNADKSFQKFDEKKQKRILDNFVIWSISDQFSDKEIETMAFNAVVRAWNNNEFDNLPNVEAFKRIYSYPTSLQKKIYELVRDSQTAEQNNDPNLAILRLQELNSIENQ